MQTILKKASTFINSAVAISLLTLLFIPIRTTAYAVQPAEPCCEESVVQPGDPHESKFFRIDGAPELSVFTANGNIEVRSNPSINGVKIDLYVRREFTLWSGSRSLDNYRIIMQQRGNSVIASVEDRRSGTRTRPGDDVRFSFVIEVPEKGSVNLRSTNGSILLEGVEGTHFIQNHNGDITVKKSSGEIRVASTSGNLNLENLSGNIFGKTVNGNIISKDNSGELRLRSVTGNLEATGTRGALIAASTSGSLNASFSDVSMGIHLETISGDVVLELPDEKGFTIDAHAMRFDFGTLRASDAPGRVRPSSASLEVRGGGIPVKLSTVSGTVRIKE
jgi:hypothetical protein